MRDLQLSHLQTWIGRTEEAEETVEPAHAAELAATLDMPRAPSRGHPLPPLWHWIYFRPVARTDALGADGHPKLGGFMPPVPLPRRMWAGGSLTFHDEVSIGETIHRTTRILDVRHRTGRQGDLVFVTLGHEIRTGRGLAISEEQQLVYREPGPAAPGRSAAPPRQTADASPSDGGELVHWRESTVPSPILLFRYSALTFNSHRIHYDQAYATDEEGYPALVVQGPLIATLLAASAERNTGQRLGSFSFRGQAPLFVDSAFDLCGRREGRELTLWAQGPDGASAMAATAVLA